MSLLAQDEQLTRRVGAASIVVLGLAIGFFVFVYGRIDWGSHVRVRVYFHTTGGLREGAPFVVAGRPVGRVEAIARSPRGEPLTPLNGDEGVVLTVAIDARDAATLDHGGDVFVASRGALSERYLELGPVDQATTMLHEGDKLLGRDPPSLDRVLQRTWDNLTTAARFAAEVRPELDALRTQIAELRGHLDGASATAIPSLERVAPLLADAASISDELHQLREGGLGGDAGLARMSAAIVLARGVLADSRVQLDTLRASADRLGSNVDALRARLGTKGAQTVAAVETALDRVRAAMDKLDPLLAQVEALQVSIARGEGSLLKLMHDPEFPEDAKELGKILKRQPWKLMDRPQH